MRRHLQDDGQDNYVNGTVRKWLPADESDFTSELTNAPAALVCAGSFRCCCCDVGVVFVGGLCSITVVDAAC